MKPPVKDGQWSSKCALCRGARKIGFGAFPAGEEPECTWCKAVRLKYGDYFYPIDKSNAHLFKATTGATHMTDNPAHSDHPMRHWDRTCPACNPDADTAMYIRIAELWKVGKMIGGDEDEVRNALLAEVHRLQAWGQQCYAAGVAAERERAAVLVEAYNVYHDDSWEACAAAIRKG